MRYGPGSVLVNFFFAPVQYFPDHRSFFVFRKTFNVYNSKNTEPIELKFKHNIRVGPVERGP